MQPLHPTAKKVLLYGLLPCSLAIAVLLGAGTWYAQAYAGKIYPGVFVGPVDVGGLSTEQAATTVSEATHEAIQNGLAVSVGDNLKTVSLVNQGVNDPDASFDLITWNVDDAVSQATTVGRNTPVLSALLPMIYGVGFRHTVALPPTLNEEQISEALTATFPGVNTPAVEAGFSIAPNGSSWNVDATESHDGQVMETRTFFDEMKNALAEHLTLPPLSVTVESQTANVKTEDATDLIEAAQQALTAAPYILTFSPPDTKEQTWELSAQDIAGYLRPERKEDATLVLGLDETLMDLIEERTKTAIHPPTDAKFEIKNGKVSEFQGGSGGWIINRERTIEEIEAVLGNAEDDARPMIIADYSDATVQTSDVNDLGITEILGIGESNFSGSPANRIKNIRNGASLLNGTLIKPEATFSLLDTLGPFTTENGYLPELVIKGDKITPELGGGLCQIGTTTFRGAMNAGLPIVERRNHSLVVSYYNDPRNHSPGTDATIYDPSPDLKFTNDTGHYILITTDMNTSTGALAFTFWGTSDGRTASYSEPIVSSWIPAGDTQNIETLDLPPGTTKCQAKHPGANASFVYTITQADGTVDEQTFTSSYRALPEICLVGVEKLSEPIEETPTDGTDTPTDATNAPPDETTSTPTDTAPTDTDTPPTDTTTP